MEWRWFSPEKSKSTYLTLAHICGPRKQRKEWARPPGMGSRVTPHLRITQDTTCIKVYQTSVLLDALFLTQEQTCWVFSTFLDFSFPFASQPHRIHQIPLLQSSLQVTHISIHSTNATWGPPCFLVHGNAPLSRKMSLHSGAYIPKA